MSPDFQHLRERGLTQEVVFRGQVIRLRVDAVALPNGEMATRELLEHPGASAVVPLLSNGDVLLVRQFRYAIDALTLEIPAGKLDFIGEDVEAAAKRELEEETGCRGGNLTYLGRLHPTPALSNEVIHVFAGRGFTRHEPKTDGDEFVESVAVPFEEALSMIRRGDITDAKTIMALLWVQAFGLVSEQKRPLAGVLDDADTL